MKTLQKAAMVIALITLFASCQTSSDPKQILSNTETKKGIMDTIANNSAMANDMIEAMMNSNNGKMMMQGNEKMNMMMMENHGTMMKMMKDNPAMMQNMMSDMMETCKNDSVMMSSMCTTMMASPKMMDMMQKMKAENKGNKNLNKMGDMKKSGGMKKM